MPVARAVPSIPLLLGLLLAACGGGGGDGANEPEPGGPRPTITALTPDTAAVGTDLARVLITGTGFAADAQVFAGPTSVHVASRTESSLLVEIPGRMLDTTGTLLVTARNPGAAASEAKPFRILARLPFIGAFLPTHMRAQFPDDLPLRIGGEGFGTSPTVTWNGVGLSIISANDREIVADVPLSLRTTPGAARVTVRSSTSGTDTSSAFLVMPPAAAIGFPMEVVTGLVGDAVWVPQRGRLYVSLYGGPNAGTVLPIDPYTGATDAPIPVGAPAVRLAASDDGRYVYVTVPAPVVKRIDLAAGAVDLIIPLGRDPNYGDLWAEDLVAIPGSPRSVAVTMYLSLSPRSGGLAVFDDAVRRPLVASVREVNRVEAGSATILYGYNNETSRTDIQRYQLTPAGPQLLNRFDGYCGLSDDADGDDEIIAGAAQVYTTCGTIANGVTLAPLQYTFGPGIVQPDVPGGRLFTYDGQRLFVRALLWGSAVVDFPLAFPDANRLVRFGADGLVIAGGDRVWILRGNAIGP